MNNDPHAEIDRIVHHLTRPTSLDGLAVAAAQIAGQHPTGPPEPGSDGRTDGRADPARPAGTSRPRCPALAPGADQMRCVRRDLHSGWHFWSWPGDDDHGRAAGRVRAALTAAAAGEPTWP